MIQNHEPEISQNPRPETRNGAPHEGLITRPLSSATPSPSPTNTEKYSFKYSLDVSTLHHTTETRDPMPGIRNQAPDTQNPKPPNPHPSAALAEQRRHLPARGHAWRRNAHCQEPHYRDRPAAHSRPGTAPLVVSHTMFVLISFRKSTAPQNRQFNILNSISKPELTILWGS